jgi:hypothetical protein
MFSFHVIIHGDDGGRPGTLRVSFEEVVAGLEALPRMFVEGDGSFVWAQHEADGTVWQVEGNLVDQGPALAHVEVHGLCSEAALVQFLAVLGWPGNKLVFQLPRRGVVLGEMEFWQEASSEEGAF